MQVKFFYFIWITSTFTVNISLYLHLVIRLGFSGFILWYEAIHTAVWPLPVVTSTFKEMRLAKGCRKKLLTNKNDINYDYSMFLCLLVSEYLWKHTQSRLQEWFWCFFLGGRRCSFVFFILQCSYLHSRVLTLTAIQHLTHRHKTSISINANTWHNVNNGLTLKGNQVSNA